MELQDFALQHMFSRLVFSGTRGEFIDHRGATADAMSKHLGMSNVLVHPTATEVTSDDGLDKFRIGIAQIYASLTNFTDFEEANDQTRGFFAMATDHMASPTVGQITIRTWDIAPVESFDALRDQLTAKLLGSAKDIAGLVGTRMVDAGWTLEFRDADSFVSVRFGPMESTQLRAALQDEQGQDSDYPASFLFLEIYREVGSQATTDQDILGWWGKVAAANRAMAKRIGDWLKEEIE